MNKKSIIEHFGGDFRGFYAQYLGEIKPAGKRIMVICPFHDDTNPSFSINPKTGAFKCHGCGISGDIFKFYASQHRLNGDFAAVLAGIAADFGISGDGAKPQPASIRKDKKRLPAERKRLVKTYDYLNLQGLLYYQKLRYDPKDFSLRRPAGQGGWIYDLQEITPVLYNLPAVSKAREVFVVEGEKDADKLTALGYTATTNFDGAGKWRDSYSQTLKGKKAVLIPDADDPGRAHMQMVAASLHGVASSVKILELPNPTKKGYDLSDFIVELTDQDAAGERLAIMAEGAAEWKPPTESVPDTKPASGFLFVHNADILVALRPVEWRILDILTDFSLYYNFGDPGSFKTFVEMDRLLCIAAGIDYHGHRVKQGSVFYIAGEGQQGIGRRIAAWHAAHKTRAANVPFFVARMPTELMDPAALENVKRAVDALAAEYGPPAVVSIDTLARNFGDGDENATKDMNWVISNLDQAFGNAFCRGLTHHTGHADKTRARGSIALHGAADAAFRVELTKAEQVLVECVKQKDAPAAPAMLFDRREIPLRIGDTEDRSFVLDLAAEGNEAVGMAKPKTASELKGNLVKALNVLRQMYARYKENLRESGRSEATPSVAYVDWRTACVDAQLYKRTDNFKTAAEKLLLRGLIRFDEARKCVYLAEMVNEDEN